MSIFKDMERIHDNMFELSFHVRNHEDVELLETEVQYLISDVRMLFSRLSEEFKKTDYLKQVFFAENEKEFSPYEK